MDVFLIPVGAERYERYCEPPDDPMPQPDEPEPPGLVRGLVNRFREMIATAERERRQAALERQTEGEPRGWTRRVRNLGMRWIAEKIAEQRLLWNLRHTSQARLVFPADLDEAGAMDILRSGLRREAERHRWWLVIDGAGFVVSGALMLVPGPNVLAYYFAFRLVGHFFSMRGARQGLDVVSWNAEPSELLAELRQVARLEPALRTRRIHEVASSLHLPHLAAFFERTAIPSA